MSTVHTPFVRRSHLAHMIEVCLGGPLPGVHVVFKQHPGERDEGPYRDLLDGLARAGGYAPPPISVVREIDLYRLLRAADAHLGLHSTVLTDAVMAGTDNLIARVEASGDLLGYVAAGVARPVTRVADLRAALDHPQPAHPAARQTFIEDHFRPGEASDRIVAEIRDEVAEAVATPSGAIADVEAADPSRRSISVLTSRAFVRSSRPTSRGRRPLPGDETGSVDANFIDRHGVSHPLDPGLRDRLKPRWRLDGRSGGRRRDRRATSVFRDRATKAAKSPRRGIDARGRDGRRTAGRPDPGGRLLRRGGRLPAGHCEDT